MSKPGIVCSQTNLGSTGIAQRLSEACLRVTVMTRDFLPPHNDAVAPKPKRPRGRPQGYSTVFIAQGLRRFRGGFAQ
jgi:hypothetical protein